MLAENYKSILANIDQAARRSNRSPADIKMVAVTKTVGVEEVRRTIALGITDFGENRVQDAEEKVAKFSEAKWHFIGHLQSNKVKNVLPAYSLIHSLDRLSLAEAIQHCAERLGLTAEVLVQVNVSGEESKYGLKPQELSGFLKNISALENIRVRGLMTMAPYVDDPEEVRLFFRGLRLLRDENTALYSDLRELSMGMTNDYCVAVEEGATIVRIGSALFN